MPQPSPFNPARPAGLAAMMVCFGLAVAPIPSFAMGGGDDSSSKASGGSDQNRQTTDMTTCPKGQVWDAKHKACVRAHSGVLPDDALADNGYALAKSGRFDEALQILDLVSDPNTPKALNYRGYATRNLGRTDEGIGYYLKAVALDPHYAQVREYLGEAYVIQGKIDLAKDQLTTIKTICGGTDCEAYEDLSDAIAKASRT